MGTDDNLQNAAEEAKGRVKEKAGEATDDRDLQAEDEADQTKANLMQAGEKVKEPSKTDALSIGRSLVLSSQHRGPGIMRRNQTASGRFRLVQHPSAVGLALQLLLQFVLGQAGRPCDVGVACLLRELVPGDVARLFTEVLFATGNEGLAQLGTALVRQIRAHPGQDLGLLLLDMVGHRVDEVLQGLVELGRRRIGLGELREQLVGSSFSPASAAATG